MRPISPLRAAILALALVAGFTAQRALAEDEKPTGWTGEFALSFAAQTGTLDTLNGELDAKTERMWEKDLFGARVTAAFGQTRDRNDNPSEDRTTQNSQALFLNHRRTINSRYLWRSALELSRDPTVDREVRFALASGPGYLFWQGDSKEKQFFEGRIGLGYRYELFDGNQRRFVPIPPAPPPPALPVPDENGYDSQFADGILSFEYRNLFFDGAMEWTHTGAAAMPFNDVNAYLVRTEGIIGIPLTEAWSFRTAVLFEYNNNAPDDQNKALTRTVVGLGYKF